MLPYGKPGLTSRPGHSPLCNIDYALPTDCHVTLSIYNILGQKVRVLVDEYQSTGNKSVTWDGRDDRGQEVTSGIYFYRLEAGDFNQSRKMLLLK
jgi:flagellar hook assembly protein FlgD